MRVRAAEYIPHPFSFGIEGRTKLPIRQELQTVRKRDVSVISEAKYAVERITSTSPKSVLSAEEVATLKPANIQALYELPAHSLIYKSPHNMRHFVAMDILSLFIGKYANDQLVQAGEEPLNVAALRYSAWTHDSFRSRFDIAGTIMNYQLHGIKASENLEKILQRSGLPQPDNATTKLVKEIDRYHDVDSRRHSQRSREVEVFTTIDKLEMTRLFHPIQVRFKLPIIAQGIHMLARKRMKAYEGSHKEFMGIMGEFLPIVDGMYRLSMQYINEERKAGKKWKDIDQYSAVVRAATDLGIVAPDNVATRRGSTYYKNMIGATQSPEQIKPPQEKAAPKRPEKRTLLNGGERLTAVEATLAGLPAGRERLTREQMEKYRVKPETFLKGDQAAESTHDVRHHAGVEIGVVLTVADIAVYHPELLERIGLNQAQAQEVLLRVAQVHDTQRMADDGESMPQLADLLKIPPDPYANVARHGQRVVDAIEMSDISTLSPEDKTRVEALQQVTNGLSQDQKEVFLFVVAHHDARPKQVAELANRQFADPQKAEQARILLEMFRIADRMELVRQFFQYADASALGQQKYMEEVTNASQIASTPEEGLGGNILQRGKSIFVNHRLFHTTSPIPELQDAYNRNLPVVAELYRRSTKIPAADAFGNVMQQAEGMGILQQ